MTGTVDHREGVVFKAAINSATLPTITATTTIPAGKTWLAHGVCKLLEASNINRFWNYSKYVWYRRTRR